MIVVVMRDQERGQRRELARPESGLAVPRDEARNPSRKHRVHQERGARKGCEKRRVTDPGNARDAVSSMDRLRIARHTRRRRSGGRDAAPPRQPVEDTPAKNVSDAVGGVARIQIGVAGRHARDLH